MERLLQQRLQSSSATPLQAPASEPGELIPKEGLFSPSNIYFLINPFSCEGFFCVNNFGTRVKSQYLSDSGSQWVSSQITSQQTSRISLTADLLLGDVSRFTDRQALLREVETERVRGGEYQEFASPQVLPLSPSWACAKRGERRRCLLRGKAKQSSAGRANGRRQALWEAFSGTARRHRFVHGVKY